MPRHLSSLDELTPGELHEILRTAEELKQNYKEGNRPAL